MSQKSTIAAASLLTGALLLNAPAYAEEEQGITQFDPAVQALVQTLSDKFQDITGIPLEKQDKTGLGKRMTESFNNNIREGYCRTVTYRITREDHPLSAYGNVCRINNEFILKP